MPRPASTAAPATAASSYGNALLLDGVDTRDPEGGSAWTFFNQNLIEEIQIGGLGAPAEYGGFTGAIINTVTKSGGEPFSGLFSIGTPTIARRRQHLATSSSARTRTWANPSVTKKLADYTVQMGGPIKRDKAFFFASVQRYYATTDPSARSPNSTDISPRLNTKFTFQPTPARHLHPRLAIRPVQPRRPCRRLAGVSGNRPADGHGGRARVGVERSVATGVRHQRAARSQVHRLRRLLLSRSR